MPEPVVDILQGHAPRYCALNGDAI